MAGAVGLHAVDRCALSNAAPTSQASGTGGIPRSPATNCRGITTVTTGGTRARIQRSARHRVSRRARQPSSSGYHACLGTGTRGWKGYNSSGVNTVPFMQIQSYSLVVVTLESTPFETSNNIFLKALPNVGSGSSVAQVEIIHNSTLTGTSGFVGGSSPSLSINVYSTTSQFEVHRQILQSEAPVYFTWNVPPGSTQISSFYLSTGDEPPGEGPIDTSP